MNDRSSPITLEQFARTIATDWEQPRDDCGNMCATCDIPMDISGDEYVCKQCGRIASYADSHLSRESSQYACRYYGSSDPLREQRSNVFEGLVARREAYLKVVAARHGMDFVPNCAYVNDAKDLDVLAPSTAILASVARIYNEIQRKASASGVPFVRRGDVKHEILAAIIFSECAKSEQRSKRDIAEMMGLRTDGFSRGYEQILRQCAVGNVILEDDKQICEDKIKFYFKKTLGVFIDDQFEEYQRCQLLTPDQKESLAVARADLIDICVRFIRSIVSHAIRYHIGVQSQLQSKIVGTIWFIVRAMRYPVTASQIDIMSGGIKKGTFLKFSRDITHSARLRFIVRNRFPHLRGKSAQELSAL